MAAVSTMIVVTTVLDTLHDEIGTLLVGAGLNGGDVQVMHGGDASIQESDYVEIGDVNPGLGQVPTIKAGRKRRDLEFAPHVHFHAVRQDLKDARLQAVSMFSTFENWVADNIDLATGIDSLWVEEIDFEVNKSRHDDHRGWRVHITAKPLVRVRLL